MNQSLYLKIYNKQLRRRIMILTFSIILSLCLLITGILKYYTIKHNPFTVTTLEDYYAAYSGGEYITISTDKILDLNLELVQTTKKFNTKDKENVTHRYCVTMLDDKIIVISIPIKDYEILAENNTGTFIIHGTPTQFKDTELEVVKKELLSQGLTPTELVSALHSTSYIEYKSAFSQVSLFFLLSGLNLFLFLLMLLPSFIQNHRGLNSLKTLSNDDFESTLREIDDDLLSPNIYKTKKFIITENYIIISSFQLTLAMPLVELLWVYEKVLDLRIFHIPICKLRSIFLAFSDRNKYKIELTSFKKDYYKVIEYLSEQCPNATIGYSKDMDIELKKNPHKLIQNLKNSSQMNS